MSGQKQLEEKRLELKSRKQSVSEVHWWMRDLLLQEESLRENLEQLMEGMMRSNEEVVVEEEEEALESFSSSFKKVMLYD